MSLLDKSNNFIYVIQTLKEWKLCIRHQEMLKQEQAVIRPNFFFLKKTLTADNNARKEHTHHDVSAENTIAFYS